MIEIISIYTGVALALAFFLPKYFRWTSCWLWPLIIPCIFAVLVVIGGFAILWESIEILSKATKKR